MSLSSANCASVLDGHVPPASVAKLCTRLAGLVEEESAFATFRDTGDWVRLTLPTVGARIDARERLPPHPRDPTPPSPRMALWLVSLGP